MAAYRPMASIERTTWAEIPKCYETCKNCLWGRVVTFNGAHACECHYSRPTTTGFPIVRADDVCFYHANERTRKWSFEGVYPPIMRGEYTPLPAPAPTSAEGRAE